jgi:hypothetical protein
LDGVGVTAGVPVGDPLCDDEEDTVVETDHDTVMDTEPETDPELDPEKGTDWLFDIVAVRTFNANPSTTRVTSSKFLIILVD